MSKYRLYTSTGPAPYRVQIKRWWGWKTIYKSAFSSSAENTLYLLRQEEIKL